MTRGDRSDGGLAGRSTVLHAVVGRFVDDIRTSEDLLRGGSLEQRDGLLAFVSQVTHQGGGLPAPPPRGGDVDRDDRGQDVRVEPFVVQREDAIRTMLAVH